MDTFRGSLGGFVILLVQVCSGQNTGLIVSDLPSSIWHSGGITTFEGYVNQFATSDKKSYTEHSLSFSYYDFEIMSMEWNGNDTLFFMEGLSKSILKMDHFDIWMNHSIFGYVTSVHSGLSYTISSRIAYDHMTGNMYWTDALYNWIAVQPVNANDDTNYKVIISDQLQTPGAISLDANNRLLFWSNHGVSTFIERSDLNGNDRRIIVQNLLWVPDIKCDPDPTRKTIYWADNLRNTLESSDYMGENRKVIYRSPNIQLFVTNIAVYRNVICGAENDDKFAFCVDRDSGRMTWQMDFYYDPWGMTVLMDKITTNTNPCKDKACEHICINSASGAVCHCKEGYDLNADSTTCSAKHSVHGKGLIISSNNSLYSVDIRVASSLTVNAIRFLTWDSPITHIAVAANKSKVIFAAQDEIVMYDLVTGMNTSLASTGKVSGLVYSWIGDDIFWSESDTGTIKLMSLDSDTKTDFTVFSGLKSPRDLAIDPHNDKLYWISTHSNPDALQIESGSFMGTGKSTKQPHLYANPSGLFYDVGHTTLFWISARSLTYYDESNKFHLRTTHPMQTDTKLLIYKDYSISTSGDNALRVFNLFDEKDTHTVRMSDVVEVNAFAIMDPSLQQKEKNKCDENNGGCEHICVPDGSTGVCQCGIGYVLESDGQNCKTKPIENKFAVAVDFSHGMIYQISISNQPNKEISAVDIPQPADPLSAVYNPPDKNVYWADYMKDQILTTKLGSNETEIVYSPVNYVVYSIAIDHSTGNIYYTAHPYVGSIFYSMIGVIHFKSHKHKTLINNIENAYSVALHPAKGYVFWIDGAGTVGRANMDGTDGVLLVAYGTTALMSITVDYEHDMVYYIDNDRIMSMDIRGSNQQTFHVNPGAGLSNMAISGGYLYCTATYKQEILKIDKTSGAVMDGWMTHVPELGRLETISVYSESDRTSIHPICSMNNGLCSTFCFPLPDSKRSCGCPDGGVLLEDHRTCKGVKICPMTILHGKFSNQCSGYVGSSCDYECYDGYAKSRPGKLNCNKDLNWIQGSSVDLSQLCKVIETTTVTTTKTTTTPTTTTTTKTTTETESTGSSGPVVQPAPLSKTTPDGYVSSGTFAGVIVVIILVFVVLVLGFIYFMYRRKSSNMFSHAKFVNSPNVPEIAVNNDAMVDDRYTAIGDIHQPTPASGQVGMENPLYKIRNENPTKENGDNTLSEQGFKTMDLSQKF